MDRKILGEKLAFKAGDILLNYFHKKHTIKMKGKKDFALDADFSSERFIVTELHKYFPNDSIISEEDLLIKGDSLYRWVIDPLDGTVNYKSKIPYYCVSIGLEKNGKLHYSFIYNPNLKNYYFAQLGKGAYQNEKKIKVNNTRQLYNFVMLYGTSHHKTPTIIKDGLKSINKILSNCRTIRIKGSTILDLCNVANGTFEGLFKIDCIYLGIAPGCLMVEEAGGKVTDFRGKKWSTTTKKLIASNGRKHNNIIKLLNK